MYRGHLASFMVATMACITAAQAGDSMIIQVDAAPHDREQSLVTFQLPAALPSGDACSLHRIDDDAEIPTQPVVLHGKPGIAWLLQQPLPAQTARQYRLQTVARSSGTPPAVTCKDDGRRLTMSVGDRTVLQYNHAIVEPPQGVAHHYRRSGYIHPLYDPSGRSVTGDFPADHLHQRALFFAWVSTTFEGRALDFWNQAAETAVIRHVGFASEPVSGSVFAEFQAQLRHEDITDPTQPRPVIDETWTVRVYNVAPFFLVDLESVQQCVGTAPLIVNEYHYGGMAMRGHAQWFDEELADSIGRLLAANASVERLAQLTPPRDYLTSEGKTWIDGNASRARWVEMHGKIDGVDSGVTVMGHPENFRAPQPVRLHPQKPYFCFAPMILGEFRIEPGKAFVSRYRYYVHVGLPDAAASERLWQDYASPAVAVAVRE